MNCFLILALMLLLFCGGGASADTFGSGPNSFEIQFVTIGEPGNPADITSLPIPAGSVGYVYRMAKYEISEQMIDKANALGGLGITKDTRGPDKPATSVTWFEAAWFVNWLNTSTGHTPAYKFDAAGAFQLWAPGDVGYDPSNLLRNSHAKYFLPSADEWHKAAYYDPVANSYWDYPTGSDSVPDGIGVVGDPLFDAVFHDGASNPQPNDVTDVGLLSPNGTAGQGGNIQEWHETAFNVAGTEQRSLQGGSWIASSIALAAFSPRQRNPLSFESGSLGLRVTSIVPEPTTIVLASIIFSVLFTRRISIV